MFRLVALSLAVAALSVVPIAGFAEDAATGGSSASTVVKANDAAAISAAVDKEVVVEGKITSAAWSRSGKVMNIDFEGGGEGKFMAVVFDRDKAKFDEALKGDAAKTLTGATVRLRGKMEKYGGKSERLKDHFQIVLRMPSQVTIETAGASGSATTKPASPAPAPAPAPGGKVPGNVD